MSPANHRLYYFLSSKAANVATPTKMFKYIIVSSKVSCTIVYIGPTSLEDSGYVADLNVPCDYIVSYTYVYVNAL